MVYTTHLWWFGGWFMIALTTLYRCFLKLYLYHWNWKMPVEIFGVGSGVRLLPKKMVWIFRGPKIDIFCVLAILICYSLVYIPWGHVSTMGFRWPVARAIEIRGTGGGFAHWTWGSCQMAGHSSEAKHIPTYTAEADSLHRKCREVDVRQLACLLQSSRCCHGLTMERLLLGRSSIFRFARQEKT